MQRLPEGIKASSSNLQGENKKAVDTLVAQGIPAMGEWFVVQLPLVLVNQLHAAKNKLLRRRTRRSLWRPN